MNDSAVTDPGRALLYQGERVVLSIGPADQLRPHVHGAAELRVSFEEPIECCTAGDRVTTATSVLIPPGVRHQNRCADPYSAVLYLDPESIDYQLLRQHMVWEDPIYVGLTNLSRARQALARLARTRPNTEDAIAAVQEHVLLGPGGPRTLDARVERVLGRLRQDPADPTPVAALADLVSLSEDRLHHLFSTEVGIPIHRYRIWRRLERAMELYFAGANLTEAAHESGFADSAHFSRVFTNMFGEAPSRLLRRYRQDREDPQP
ncbi:MAG: AraC family transcriptional regulator [Actinomycetota bacterium]